MILYDWGLFIYKKPFGYKVEIGMSLRENFNEDTRVKFPATIHFLRLGYKYRSYNKAIEGFFVVFDSLFEQRK